MSRLEGSWTFTLERAAGASRDLSTLDAAAWPLSRVEYRFCMWPKGERLISFSAMAC
jgi:hypothetical protein